jgi:hypothetical protein
MRRFLAVLVVGLTIVAVAAAAARQGAITPPVPRPSTTALGQPTQAPQPAPVLKPGVAIILGRVVEAGTNTGVPGAVVTLSSPALGAPTAVFANGVAGGPRRVMADGQGQFLFRDLPAGAYVIAATAAGIIGATRGPAPGWAVRALTSPCHKPIATIRRKTASSSRYRRAVTAVGGPITVLPGSPIAAPRRMPRG